MSTRPGRFDLVRTDAGWHALWRYPGNLLIAWQTQVYGRQSDALHAIELQPGIRSVTHHSAYGWEANTWAHDAYPLEVREVDEREVTP